jgi:hypothetical protein
MQFGVFWHSGLNEKRGRTRIHAHGEPIDHHVQYIILENSRIAVVRGKGVPVGDKKEAFVLVL